MIPKCSDGTSSSESVSSCPAKGEQPLGTECLKEGKFGLDYRGTVSVGKDGGVCRMWTETMRVHSKLRDEKGLGAHNYCRQGSEHPNPWCWTGTGNEWQDCEIPACTHLDEGTGGHGNFRRWMNLYYFLRTEKKMSVSAIITAVTKAKTTTSFKYSNKGNPSHFISFFSFFTRLQDKGLFWEGLQRNPECDR